MSERSRGALAATSLLGLELGESRRGRHSSIPITMEGIHSGLVSVSFSLACLLMRRSTDVVISASVPAMIQYR